MPVGYLENDPDLTYGDLLPLARSRSTGELSLAWPQSARTLWNSILRATSGDYTPGELPGPNLAEDVAEIASALAGGSVANTAPAGSLGIFAGRRARNAPSNLDSAPTEPLQAAGTWLFRGLEGEPRFEIPDTGLQFREGILRIPANSQSPVPDPAWQFQNMLRDSPRIGDLVEWPSMELAYPEVLQYPIRAMASDLGNAAFGTANNAPAFFLAPGNAGAFSSRSANPVLSWLAHEGQHAIQDIEGWPRGTSPRTALANLNAAGKHIGADITTPTGAFDIDNVRRVLAALALEPDDLRLAQGGHEIQFGANAADILHSLYSRTAGEEEARAVQYRFMHREPGPEEVAGWPRGWGNDYTSIRPDNTYTQNPLLYYDTPFTNQYPIWR